jgi:hypothetical protein
MMAAGGQVADEAGDEQDEAALPPPFRFSAASAPLRAFFPA